VDRARPQDPGHFKTARKLKLNGHRRHEWYRADPEQVNKEDSLVVVKFDSLS
jgi:hypothetical protein